MGGIRGSSGVLAAALLASTLATAVGSAPMAAGAVVAPVGTAATVLGGAGSGDSRLIAMDAVDISAAGNFLYVADTNASVIRRIDTTTHDTTVIGGNTVFPETLSGQSPTHAGDGGPATAAQIEPQSIEAASDGTVYVGEEDRVRRITPGGTITTWVGGAKVLDGGRSTTSRTGRVQLSAVSGLDLDASGNLLVSEYRAGPNPGDDGLGAVRKLTPAGQISFLGGGLSNAAPLGDGGPAVAAPLINATCVAHDASGAALVCSQERVRRIAADGKISTVAGGGTFPGTGDGGPATSASMIARDALTAPNGDLYIADLYHASVRKVSGGTITSLPQYPAMHFGVQDPVSLAMDSAGRLYASAGSVIWRYESGSWVRFAGTETAGNDGEPLETTASTLQTDAFRLANAADGTLYLGNGLTTKRVSTGGAVTEVAGDGDPTGPTAVGTDGRLLIAAYDGLHRRKADGSWELVAEAPDALDLAVMPNGDALIAPFDGNKIFRVTMAGAVTTFAGNGTDGFSGDNGPATSAAIGQVSALGSDAAGNVWMSTSGGRIRKVSTGGTITTVAGNGTFPEVSAADGSNALSVGIASISDLAVAPDGSSVYLLELPFAAKGHVRRLHGGVLTTVVGGGRSLDGNTEGHPAVAIPVDVPMAIDLEPGGTLLLLDARNDFGSWKSIVRRITLAPATTPLAGVPTGLKVTAAGVGALSLSWTAPTTNAGSIVAYRIKLTPISSSLAGITYEYDTAGPTTAVTLPGSGAPLAWKIQVASLTGAGRGTYSPAITAVPPFATAAAHVGQQYQDFLGRTPTSAELSQGITASTTGIATATNVPAQLAATDHDIAPVTRLFLAYFLRMPDTGGLTYWVGKHRKGTTLDHISASFAASSEFTNRYGSLSNTNFVRLVYQNVLGRTADPGGLSHWVAKLDSGTSRGTVMTNFSESSENLRKTAAVSNLSIAVYSMLRRAPSNLEGTWAKAVNYSTLVSAVQTVMLTTEYDQRI